MLFILMLKYEFWLWLFYVAAWVCEDLGMTILEKHNPIFLVQILLLPIFQCVYPEHAFSSVF